MQTEIRLKVAADMGVKMENRVVLLDYFSASAGAFRWLEAQLRSNVALSNFLLHFQSSAATYLV
jgi:hypothetical protein